MRLRPVSLSILLIGLVLSACSAPGVRSASPEATSSPHPAAQLSTPMPATATPAPILLPASTFNPTPKVYPNDVSQFVEQAQWGKGAIVGSEFSPDGKRLRVVTTVGVYIYDAVTLKQLDFIPDSSTWPVAAFSPDGSLLAMASGSTVTLLRLADKTEVAHLETKQGKPARLLFSPDGHLLASLVQPPGEEVYTQSLELWSVPDRQLLATWTAGSMPDLAFTPDSQMIYAWNVAQMEGVHRWQVPSGKPLPALKDLNPSALAFSPRGGLMAIEDSFNAAGEVLIQRISDGMPVRKLTWDHPSTGGQLRFSPDGSLLLGLSFDGAVQAWRVSDGNLLRSFTVNSAAGWFLAISPDNQILALPSLDGLVFTNITDGQVIRRLGDHFGALEQVAFSPNGDRVAALVSNIIPEDNGLAVWSFPNGRLIYLLTGTRELGLAWSPDGNWLALAGWDGKVRILRSADGTVYQTLPGHSEQVQSVAWSPDGTEIASSSMESVKVWQASDGKLLYNLSAAGGWANSLRFSPDGKWLAGMSVGLSAGSRIEVWQMSDGQRIAELPALVYGDSPVIDFAPDGTFLAVAEQVQISLWHLNEDKPFQQLPITEGGGITLRISPDGSLLAGGLTDGTVQLWQLPQGKRLGVLTGGNTGIASLDFSSDGKTLLAASRDGTIKFWNIPK